MPKVPDFEHPPPLDGPIAPPDFEGACFVAYMDNSSVKYNRSGELAFTLVVPREHLNEGVRSVYLLAGNPLPVAVQMEVWNGVLEESEDQKRPRALAGLDD
jgi:hypothetical protein